MPLSDKQIAQLMLIAKTTPSKEISRLMRGISHEFSSAIANNEVVQQSYYAKLYNRLCKLDDSLTPLDLSNLSILPLVKIIAFASTKFYKFLFLSMA